MSVKNVSVRMEEEMLSRLAFIAEYEGRSINSHILVLARESIRTFETEHGAINGQIDPGENVKPGRK